MSEPVRMCAGCREREPQGRLLRLVWDAAASQVALDAGGRLPGRGVYLHADCAGRVLRNAGIGRGLRRPVDADQVRRLLGEAPAARLGDSGSRR
ncbi:MAG: YlxR family protein [Propionicimonas sp.]